MKSRVFKAELTATVICVYLYLIATNLGDTDAVRALVKAIFAIGLIVYLKVKNKMNEVGFTADTNPQCKKPLYYIPLMIIAMSNLICGIDIGQFQKEILFACLNVGLAAIAEELLFRGMLFHVLVKKNAKMAVVLTSVCFGIIHLGNLGSGQDVVLTLLQIGCAFAFSLMSCLLVYKTNRIVPGILCHCVLNIISALNPTTPSLARQCAVSGVIIAVSLLYAWYLIRNINDKTTSE